jgi:chitosanase
MISRRQKRTIEQVLNIFETSTPEGKYHVVAVNKDGANSSRQISYGRSQTTEQGNLNILLERYIANNGIFAPQFIPYLPKIKVEPLADDTEFKSLLKQSALQDPIMRETQDEFFEQLYYQPAYHFFKGNQFRLPLSMLVIYDSYIHSGHIPPYLRNRFPERTPLNGGKEESWVTAYVNTRHDWLARHTKLILRNTVYRTNFFKQQIHAGNWKLKLPVVVRGVEVLP